MDLFEKINRSFGSWYEGLFGASGDVRPKDILRKILVAMEEHRKEGFDSKVYVPNQYVLEIAVDDEEEKDYLLSFLDRDELETAIKRYCQQNHYHIRGALDFTVKEVDDTESKRRDKIRVRCRYDAKKAPSPEPTPVPQPVGVLPALLRTEFDDDPTVYEVAEDSETGTVPAVAQATLEIRTSGKPPFEFAVCRGAVTIGRSARAGNDIVLEHDGMASRRHARLELDADGRFTVYDLDTTNGTKVNGRKVDNRTLTSGDEIEIGTTKVVFRQNLDEQVEPEAAGANRPSSIVHRPSSNTRPARLVVLDGVLNGDEFVLASETIVGRALTNDVVLPDRSVATRHARIRRGEPFVVEAIDAGADTRLNGERLQFGTPAELSSGDCLELGVVALRFEDDRA